MPKQKEPMVTFGEPWREGTGEFFDYSCSLLVSLKSKFKTSMTS
jgi:hypothetical protein